MVFSSIPFLFYFLPLALGAYFLTPRRWRNAVLLLVSLVFYGAGGARFLLVLLATGLVDFLLGLVIGRGVERRDERLRRTALAAALVFDLAVLAWFKYANFLVDQIDTARGWFGLGTLAWAEVLLPIGISFFTFQRMSYSIDVARGRYPALRDPVTYFLFPSLFPHQIAGPIVRYDEIREQLEGRRESIDLFATGAARFAHGLAKKVLIADSVAVIANAAFDGTAAPTFLDAWLGALAFTVQIYFDFSGYSDMAIGLGMMFGFRFPENFAHPYSAVSITDFWRRWHMTLSRWFRDYLYIPLGGSRRGAGRTYANLFTVFFLTGLWHGAAWTFVAWGLYHGALLVLERLRGDRGVQGDVRWPWLRRAVVFLLVVVGWVVFRAEDVGQAATFLAAMAAPSAAGVSPVVADALTARATAMLLLGLGVALLPRDRVAGLLLADSRRPLAYAWRLATVLLLFPLAAATAASGTFSPFLYFRF